MKSKIILFLACPIFLAASLGFGQSPNAPLTWKDCVALALGHNPDLASSNSAREASRFSYKGSYNGFLPSVTLSNSYNDSGGNSTGDPGKSQSGSAYWQAQGSVHLDILNASHVAGIKTSAALLTQAEANLWQSSSLLRLSLRRAYAQLLFAQKNVDVSKIIRKKRQQSAQMVSLRYESGRESKGNMLRAKAQLLQAEADLSQALRDLRTAQRALDRQLGVDNFQAVSVAGTFSDQPAPALPSDERALLARRPDIAVQEAAVKLAEASLKQSRSSLWPSLSANYSRSGTDTKELPTSYGWSFSGILSLPLFGGGLTETYYAVSAAQKSLEKSQLDLRSARDQAIVDIETSWSNFAGAMDQSRVQSALLDAARQRNEEADVRYNSGLLTYDNWEIIASDRVNQERQALQAQLNTSLTQANWEKSLGVRVEE